MFGQSCATGKGQRFTSNEISSPLLPLNTLNFIGDDRIHYYLRMILLKVKQCTVKQCRTQSANFPSFMQETQRSRAPLVSLTCHKLSPISYSHVANTNIILQLKDGKTSYINHPKKESPANFPSSRTWFAYLQKQGGCAVLCFQPRKFPYRDPLVSKGLYISLKSTQRPFPLSNSCNKCFCSLSATNETQFLDRYFM